MNSKKRIKNDIILIIFLLVIVCFIGTFIYLFNRNNTELYVEICVNGRINDRFILETGNDSRKELNLETGNVLIVENGAVYIKDADCPDKLCVKQGKITKAGQSIICLPNKLVVRIVGNDDDGLDVVQ